MAIFGLNNSTHLTRRLIAAAAILSVLAAASSISADNGLKAERRGNMFVVLTEYYYVETDVSADFAVEIAEHLHAVGATYYQLLSEFGNGAQMERFRVSVYRDRQDYDEVVGPAAANTRGLYDPRSQHLLATAGPDTDEILHILRHEAFHQFVHHFLGVNVPIWVNEGLAEYFCYARLQDGNLRGGEIPPNILRYVQRAIGTNNAIPLRELAPMSVSNWNNLRETNPARGALAYAQSHLLAHFLMESDGGRHRRRMHTYISNINRGISGRRAFESAFGNNLTALEQAWARYVMSLEPSPRYLCRENLQILGELLIERGRGERYTAEEFREGLIMGRLGEWQKGDPNGRPISHDQPDQIATLFKCPFDEGPSERVSYEFHYESDDSALPVIVCEHHGGYTIKLHFAFDRREQRWWHYISEESGE